MSSRSVPLFALSALVAACAQSPPPPRVGHELENALRTFQAAQERFRAGVDVPQTFDFPGHGKVTVREVSLDGYPAVRAWLQRVESLPRFVPMPASSIGLAA